MTGEEVPDAIEAWRCISPDVTLCYYLPTIPPKSEFQCGRRVLDSAKAQFERPALPTDPIAGFFGVPVKLDDSLDPDEWQMVDEDGNVLHHGRWPQ